MTYKGQNLALKIVLLSTKIYCNHLFSHTETDYILRNSGNLFSEVDNNTIPLRENVFHILIESNLLCSE